VTSLYLSYISTFLKSTLSKLLLLQFMKLKKTANLIYHFSKIILFIIISFLDFLLMFFLMI